MCNVSSFSPNNQWNSGQPLVDRFVYEFLSDHNSSLALVSDDPGQESRCLHFHIEYLAAVNKFNRHLILE